MIVTPLLNASLNGLSAIFLFTGLIFIRQKNREAHRVSMLTATACSVLFLISYVVYHASHGVTAFQRQGLIRVAYFTILISHTALAMAVPLLAGRVLYLALRNQTERHKRLARVVFPIWMYVSVTGVVIYWFLYSPLGTK